MSLVRRLTVPLFVTLALLAVIRLLHHVPIAGVAEFAARQGLAQASSFSVGAVAIQAWLIGTAVAQLAVLVLPERWTRWISRDGYANPFCIPVLLGVAWIAYEQASGVAISLRSMINPANGVQFERRAIVSLMAGTSGLIAAAWLIDRFGLGRGFWTVFAMQSIISLVSEVPQWPLLADLPTPGLLLHAASGAVLAGVVALTVLITRLAAHHRHNQKGSLELVAWPLLLVHFAMMGEDFRKGAPEIIPVLLVLTLLLLALIVFVITRLEGRRHLFVPLLAVLAFIETAAYLALSWSPFGLPIPLPTASIVATVAVLTVYVQEFLWHRRQAGTTHSAEHVHR